MSDVPREVASRLERAQGMSLDAKARLKAFNESRSDWWGVCKECGAQVSGTLEVLRQHRCGEPNGTK